MRSPDNVIPEEGLSRPNSAAGKLQRVLLGLLREHEREKDGLPTYPRLALRSKPTPAKCWSN
jgi:hypothetical protein